MPLLYPIKLSATPDGWRLFSVRKADPAFQKFSQKVFERDQFTCQFCGFQAKQHQEVVNLDQNYRNNKLNNLVTACCFCSQCFFLEMVGKDDYGGGVLVYLPEVGQGELNGFCHVLFCAMSNANNYRNDSQNIYRGLKLRSQIVEKQLGEGMSDPTLLGRMLLDTPDKQNSEVGMGILEYLRLLPSYTKFTKQVEDWAQAALDDISEK
jgi:intracellular multiplication protein IcmJ